MRPIARNLIVALLGLSMAGAAQAAKVTRVDIRGLDEAMTINVRTSLSLVDAIDRDVSGRRLGYLVREAENETREALEPFGYYSATITVERDRDDDTGDTSVVITVLPGEPVRVRESAIAIDGPGADDRYLNQEIAAFTPAAGDIFDHGIYEASKARITRRLAERGYLDADFTSRRVAVTRTEHAADIDLRWDSGNRYDMGPTTFVQSPRRILRDGIVEHFVYWDEASYYHQGKLDRLRESLAKLDYFSSIDIEPRPQEAVDGRVPTTVTLTPAKRSIYTAGLSYGTDSGAGVRLGLERRYVNDRGHKALAQVDWAVRRKTLTTQYRIPAFGWIDGWYTISAQAADEQTDYIDNRRIEFVGARSGEINANWTAVAAVHALRERWAYEAERRLGTIGPHDYRYASYTYPSLRGEYLDTDDRLYPRRGIGGAVVLRGGLDGAGSDANFLQAQVTARLYRGLGERTRLIARGEVGHTLTDSLVDLPPNLRFHAGGDRSIRGYAWREVGPRIGDEGDKFPVGAKNVITGSVEFEQYFNAAWGAAVFVDSGSAFNDAPDFRTGVGVGLRWRSPVGPLRIDVARGLDDPDSGFQLYLNIGPDL
ncbi:autotransporter assembly complex protein TamA [Aerolutibacter ruishenii]|uniref:Translocation and assembly module subunit TamA n=1 Tax=Aerolutibacter ruishenii TaxID=686800 RepID=A0A562M0X7_9GAMM|nr:autotransporter assembly complex family protein [Lysobacter ruishenii]TWI13595.1 autotransporter secretion outer membrane protein TamA [Lysobacter ruishenii]